MKPFLRLGSLVIALGTAGLLAGCASSHNVSRRVVRAHDFEVVETSTKRTLNPKEMAVLKAKVAAYLDQEGATASGDYYVKVFLAPDKEGVPADWVIVRFSRGDMRFELLGSTETYAGTYRSYAAYDYYPYGYDNFGRISFQYYDDPYYGSRYYFPPSRRGDHDRNHDRDGNHNHDRDREGNHDGDHNRPDDHPQPSSAPHFKPINPVGTTPQVTRTRWNGDSAGQDNPSRERHQPQRGSSSSTPSTPQAERQPERTRDSGGSPATRSELHRSQPARTESSQPAPSYSPPARSESSSSSNSSSNPSPRESGRAVVREKFE